MAYDPILVSAGMDKTIRFWNVAKQENSFSLEYKDSQINAMCITPDGNQLAIAAWQHVRVYSLQNPTPQGLHAFNVHEQKNVTAIGFESGGRWMYTAGEDGTAKIWDMRVTQLNCQRIFQVKTPVHSVALHPNQSELMVSDSSGIIYVWDLRTDIEDSLMMDVEMSEYVLHLDIDRMGQQCAAVTNRGNLFMWNINRKDLDGPLLAMNAMSLTNESGANGLDATDATNSEATDASKNRVDVSGRNSRLTEEDEDEAAEEEKDDQENADDEDNAVTLSAGNDRQDIASAYLPPPDCATSMSPLAPPPMLPETPVRGDNIRLSRDYQTGDGFYNPNYLQQQQSTNPAELPLPPQQQSFTSQPPPMSSTMMRSTVKIRAHPKFALKCRFRPDSLALATTSADQTTKSWSVTNHKLLNTYTVPGCRWVWDCAFTNDSHHMLTASSDGVIRMWDVDTREVVGNLCGHSLGITAMTFRDVA